MSDESVRDLFDRWERVWHEGDWGALRPDRIRFREEEY
jgi:hypothetical protein